MCSSSPRSAMKNADQMLKAIISLVDTSGDGKIQYEGEPSWREFRMVRPLGYEAEVLRP
jgi:hypothetical protein